MTYDVSRDHQTLPVAAGAQGDIGLSRTRGKNWRQILYDAAWIALTCGGVALSSGCNPTRTPTPATQQVPTVGYVVDARQRPIADARVRIKGSSTFIKTDDLGMFSLDRLLASENAPTKRAGLRLTAAKPGFLIGGIHWPTNENAAKEHAFQIQLNRLPTADHPAYQWVDPTPSVDDAQRCGNCHDELYDQWSGGGHAAAATNPHFLSIYSGQRADGTWASHGGLLTDYPEGASVCASCHAPSADWDEMAGDLRDVSPTARLGVHCDYCHKIQRVELQPPGLSHGRLAVHLLRPAPRRPSGAANSETHGQDLRLASNARPTDARHPLDQTTATGQLFFGPLDDVDRGEDSYSPIYSTSEYCATCHEGVLFGVPVYTTYSEWQTSQAAAAGKTCQACHMRPDGMMTNVAPGFGGIERAPDQLASHQLLPGGRPSMLKNCIDVQSRLVMTDSGPQVQVTVQTHDVGHQVPTGFVDRHLILLVEAFDANQQPIAPNLGEQLPAAVGPDWADKAGSVFAKQLVAPDGSTPVPFWTAGVRWQDTRLRPDHRATYTYGFPPTAARFRVRLVYRRFWYATMTDMRWASAPMSIVVADQLLERGE